MSNDKLKTPKGTRDFSPIEMNQRNYIFSTIRSSFNLFGYLPIETPAMENLDTLTGKYGEEGDRLIFKILNSGNFFEGISYQEITNLSPAKLSVRICEKALRYDLTVPFARYIVQNRNQITFPFKRYQIQPVWRADRPQKGRYREFYQCDADIIGSNSLLNEVELIQLVAHVFNNLNISVIIKLNNRKILAGIVQCIEAYQYFVLFTNALDKIEKIGVEAVVNELQQQQFPKSSIEKLLALLSNLTNKSSYEKLKILSEFLQSSKLGLQGIAETEFVLHTINEIGLPQNVRLEFDFTLARGLDYYTGAIIEVKATGVEIGSISGGGRYDNLTGIFGLPGVSGVGISFGADRIYDVMNQLNLFPSNSISSTKVLFVNFGKTEELYCLKLLKELRANNISAELYPDNVKLKKQMEYANDKKIPFVALVGEDEIKKQTITVKNMNNGNQISVSLHDLIKMVESH